MKPKSLDKKKLKPSYKKRISKNLEINSPYFQGDKQLDIEGTHVKSKLQRKNKSNQKQEKAPTHELYLMQQVNQSDVHIIAPDFYRDQQFRISQTSNQPLQQVFQNEFRLQNNFFDSSQIMADDLLNQSHLPLNDNSEISQVIESQQLASFANKNNFNNDSQPILLITKPSSQSGRKNQRKKQLQINVHRLDKSSQNSNHLYLPNLTNNDDTQSYQGNSQSNFDQIGQLFIRKQNTKISKQHQNNEKDSNMYHSISHQSHEKSERADLLSGSSDVKRINTISQSNFFDIKQQSEQQRNNGDQLNKISIPQQSSIIQSLKKAPYVKKLIEIPKHSWHSQNNVVDNLTYQSQKDQPQSQRNSRGNRNWNKLSNIIRTIMLIKRTDTKNLEDPLKTDILNDPRRHIRAINDPDHLVNKKNENGQTPLYVAAKNGHLRVIQFFIEEGANPHLLSIITSSNEEKQKKIERESILDVAIGPKTIQKELQKLVRLVRMFKL
ncbi:UNKNOWN [Stylonychia lemnae]|uniref:Uncharacterized protein n=1 Tax=Stylonychia lemnae TaxID=5949 RepID=A0A078AC22_STYLE|nr:UNKNOWN [Stylonychia lemnae]|eukprot:CDW79759.1 UNKNOWN [Stylonychia lemnae]